MRRIVKRRWKGTVGGDIESAFFLSVKSHNPCESAIPTVMDDYEKILDELNEALAA